MLMNPYGRGRASGAFEALKKVGADYVGVASQLDAKALQTHLTEKTGYGVVSGLGVTAHGTPDMAVAIAAGMAYMSDGTRHAPSAVVSQAVTAADATNPRIDIVYLSSAGVITYLAGTAAASPVAPTLPTGALLLAEISVAVNQATIQTANIVTRKKGLWTEDWITPTLVNGWAHGTAGIRYMKDVMGFVHVEGEVTGGSGTFTRVFLLPTGYRPSKTLYFAALSAFGVGSFTVAPTGSFDFAAGTTSNQNRVMAIFKAEA